MTIKKFNQQGNYRESQLHAQGTLLEEMRKENHGKGRENERLSNELLTARKELNIEKDVQIDNTKKEVEGLKKQFGDKT